MDFILNKIASVVIAGVLTLSSLAGYTPTIQKTIVEDSSSKVGDFYPTGGGTYRLKTSIGTTDTTVVLSSFKEPISNIPYTMSYMNTSVAYGTLDPQNPTRSEFISFTGITQNSDGSAYLTGVTRGLGRSYPYSASSTLRQAHSGQSIFILSDSPQLFNQYAVKANNETITGQWTFSTFPVTPSTPFASTTAAGFVQIPTRLEMGSGTVSGSSGGYLAIPTTYATSVSQVATSSVVITKMDGKIDKSFIATTSTSTYVGDFPAWHIGKQIRTITTTGTSTFTVPSGITKLFVETIGGGGGGGNCSVAGSAAGSGGGGGGGGYASEYVDVTGTTTVQVYVSPTAAAAATGTWSTFGTNGFYLYANGGGAGESEGNGGTGGTASGGDINITGQGGGSGHAEKASFSYAIGGAGGSSKFGGGGAGVSLKTGGDAGIAGGNYGGGGSGAACSNTGAANGGGGAQGIVIIRW